MPVLLSFACNSIADILGQIDIAIQYGEDAEPRIREDEYDPERDGDGDGGDGGDDI